MKIIDFGTATEWVPKDQNDHLTEKIGTPFYIAPEVLHRNYNKQCDLWSCGVILYILLSGQPPFIGKSDIDTLNLIKKNKTKHEFKPEPVWELISKEAKDLISKLLDRNPETRITAEQALKHEFIVKNYVSDVDRDIAKGALENISSFRFKPNTKLSQAFYAFIVN